MPPSVVRLLGTVHVHNVMLTMLPTLPPSHRECDKLVSMLSMSSTFIRLSKIV